MGNIAIPASGGTGKYQVIVHTDPNATVEASNGKITKTFEVVNGVAMLNGLTSGAWMIRTYLRGHTRTYNVYIQDGDECIIIYLHYNMVPDFSCTNLSFKIVTDADVPIAGGIGTVGNWKIRFEAVYGSYGTIKFNDLKGQFIDIFLCGGGAHGQTAGNPLWGASGGAGGYTRTLKNFRAEEGVEYKIVVGGPSGTSSFSGGVKNPISISAAGGTAGYQEGENIFGGNGGSGGGAGAARGNDTVESAISGKSGDGGSGGNNGTDGTDGIWYWWYDKEHKYEQVLTCSYGGSGQGRTTTEFEEVDGIPYSPGGAGGAMQSQYVGKRGNGKYGANSGAGGSATNPNGWSMSGQSGIVVIRNSRGQYGFDS